MMSMPEALEKGQGSPSCKVMQTRIKIGRMKPEEMVSALARSARTHLNLSLLATATS